LGICRSVENKELSRPGRCILTIENTEKTNNASKRR
jgi:hypothetical protein